VSFFYSIFFCCWTNLPGGEKEKEGAQVRFFRFHSNSNKGYEGERQRFSSSLQMDAQVQRMTNALTLARTAVDADRNAEYVSALWKYKEVHLPPCPRLRSLPPPLHVRDLFYIYIYIYLK
jgi:hypothetical protein